MYVCVFYSHPSPPPLPKLISFLISCMCRMHGAVLHAVDVHSLVGLSRVEEGMAARTRAGFFGNVRENIREDQVGLVLVCLSCVLVFFVRRVEGWTATRPIVQNIQCQLGRMFVVAVNFGTSYVTKLVGVCRNYPGSWFDFLPLWYMVTASTQQ